MKSAKIDEEKLKKVIEVLFVREFLGITIYDNLTQYPQITHLIDRMRNELLRMICYALDNNSEHLRAKEEVLLTVQELEAELRIIPIWKISPIFDTML